MKAATINEYGSTDTIKVVDNWPSPIVPADHAVVKVHAAGINPFDAKVREGVMRLQIPFQFPKAIGMDLAGVVSEVGSNVTDFKVGDEVYGQADFFGGGGSIAEFTIAKPSSLAQKPSNVSFTEAAALPLTGVSAYQALVDNMKLSSGQKILIHGGAGGIGSYAIQLAKSKGAFVATTTSPKDIDYVKELGADQIIDFTNTDFTQEVKDYDCVLDLIGGDVYKKSFSVLKPGGIIVSLAEQPDNELAEKYNVKPRHQSTKVDTDSLKKVSQLVEAGTIKPKIEKVFPIGETSAAFNMLENDHPRGKVIINIA